MRSRTSVLALERQVRDHRTNFSQATRTIFRLSLVPSAEMTDSWDGGGAAAGSTVSPAARTTRKEEDEAVVVGKEDTWRTYRELRGNFCTNLRLQVEWSSELLLPLLVVLEMRRLPANGGGSNRRGAAIDLIEIEWKKRRGRLPRKKSVYYWVALLDQSLSSTW